MNQLGVAFGPNHASVVDLLVRYRALCPYRCLGEPTPVDESLIRVDFGFLLAHRDNRDAPWEGNLARAEGVILQALRESERWPVEDNIQSAVFHPKPPLPPDPVLDDLLSISTKCMAASMAAATAKAPVFIHTKYSTTSMGAS